MLISTFPSPDSVASTSKYVGSIDLTPVGLIPGPKTLTLEASYAGFILTFHGLLLIGLPPYVMSIV